MGNLKIDISIGNPNYFEAKGVWRSVSIKILLLITKLFIMSICMSVLLEKNIGAG